MTVMYLPALLSLREVIGHLVTELQDYGLQYDIIVTELLKEIFSSHTGNYGINGVGPLGALKCQMPENSNLADEKAADILHRAHLLLVDTIVDVAPQSRVDQTFPYYYANGDTFVLYIPTEPDTVPEAIRAKLVPSDSVRYFNQ